jgi:hypothetical protein
MHKLAVAIAIVGTLAVSTAPAEAQYHNRGHGGGGGWVAPLVGGMVLGGVLYGLSQPSYAAPPTYYAPAPQFRTECQMVPVYDRHGYFRGERRECYQVPNY